MQVIAKEEFLIKSYKYISELKKKLFIYPTDTIYGIGCDATNEELVTKVRELKESNQPFSIIPPSMHWVVEHCEEEPRLKEWMKKLPGPYTLILTLKNRHAVAPSVTHGKNTIGIRIPDHWFTKVVQMLEVPIITTSANKTGENFMTKVDDLSKEFHQHVDYVIDEGEKKGKPSTLVHFKEDVEVKER